MATDYVNTGSDGTYTGTGGATGGVTLDEPPVPGQATIPIPGLPNQTGTPNIPVSWQRYLPLIQMLGGLGAQLGGAVLQQNDRGKGYSYLDQINKLLQGNAADGKYAGGGTMDQARGGATGLLDGSNPWSQMLSQGLMGNIRSLNDLLPGLIGGQENNLVYQDPNMAAQLRSLTDLLSQSQGMAGAASKLVNSGGQTDSQGPLAAFSQLLMGGRAPGQSNLLGTGGSVLDAGGMTPELRQALGVASGIASGGGRTPLTDRLAARGQSLAAGNPLLSLDQTASFAADQAAHQYKNAARTARTQAVARGAGAGAVVANGAGDDAMADYSDDALAGTSQAMQNALLGRQSLGLQQLNSGLNTGLSAAQLQQTLQGSGLGALTGLTNASTSRLGVGGNLTNDALGASTQGGSLYDALLGRQGQNLGLGFQAGTTATGQSQNILQTALQDLMSGRMDGAQLGQVLAQLYGQNTDRLASGIGQGLDSSAKATSLLGNQGSTWLDFAKSMMGDSTNTGASVANLFKQPNSYSTVLNNLGGATQPGTSVNVNVRPPNLNIPIGRNGFDDGFGNYGGGDWWDYGNGDDGYSDL